MSPALSVVLPALDEAPALDALLPALRRELDRLGLSYELIVVDGGSRDGTAAVAARHGARALLQASRGFGGALKEGFAASRGERVLVMDADGSHPPEMVERLWERRGEAEVVIASRFCPGGSAEMPPWRYALSRLLNGITRLLLDLPVSDGSGGFRLYSGARVRGLPVQAADFSAQQEILARVIAGGGRALEVPFRYAPRIAGASKARLWPWALSYLKTFARVRGLLAAARGSWTADPDARAGFAAALLLGLCLGAWGFGWGLPGEGRLRALAGGRPSAESAARMAEEWRKLYSEIRRSHETMREEPVTYVDRVERREPGWSFPSGGLLNSYRAFLLQSSNPDEKKAFIILSQMRPWKLEFEPLYTQYGGAFIYPLGGFLWKWSKLGALTLTPDLAFYLSHPEQMGRLYGFARLFALIFHLLALAGLYSLGARLSGWRTGLLACLFYALSPTAVVNSHLAKPHAYAAMWAFWSAWAMLLAAGGGRARHYLLCGLFAGLAVGSNLGMAPTFAFPALAGLWRRDKKALWGLLLAGAVCAAFNPYLAFSSGPLAWELNVYAGEGVVFAPRRWWGLLRSALNVEPLLLAACLAGLVSGWRRGGERRLVALAAILAGGFLLLRLSIFFDEGSLRFYLAPIGLGCLLAADLLQRLPARAWLILALCADLGLRSFVYLENMRRHDSPLGTRLLAADWIEREVPPGASIGMLRYPEPSWTPPFRWDRYALVFAPEAAALVAAGPDYIVCDDPHRAFVDSAGQNKYHSVVGFRPFAAGWARPVDLSNFANIGITIYRKQP